MVSVKDRLSKCFGDMLQGVASGNVKTFAPFVSLFQINGKQADLSNHYQLLPLYNVRQPRKLTVMVARQSGKTQNMTISSQIRSSLLPWYNTVIVQPRFEQIKRYNSATYVPTMKSCPLWKDIIPRTELDKMGLKKFNAGGMTYMVSAFLSADSSRGIANASASYFDEVQDIELQNIPIIQQTMASSLLYGFTIETGTPKTTDTTLGVEWDASSKAEWVVKCQYCGYFNIPNPIHDLMKMVGKTGAICAHCGKSINPITGCYVHAVPSLMYTHAGYHLSQTIHPMHCLNERKWPDVLHAIESLDEMTLYNEIFGWPYDSSVVPLTLGDLEAAQNKHHYAEPDSIPRNLRETYQYITMGVDWDGGGALSDSFTVVTVVGLRKQSDVIDCIYAERFQKGMRVGEVTRRIKQIWDIVQPNTIAYDACGNGHVCKEYLLQTGVPAEKTLPVKYTSPGVGAIMMFHDGVRELNSLYYSLDKSRSLAVIIEAIKHCKVTLPMFDSKDRKGYTFDLLALVEMPTKTRSNDFVFLIGRKSGYPDDFAHALNFAVSSIWDKYQSYPHLGQRYSTSDLADNSNDGVPEDVWTSPEDYGIFQDNIDASANFYQSDGMFEDEQDNPW